MPLSKRNRRNLILLLVILGVVVITPRVVLNLSAVSEPVISFSEFKKIEEVLENKKHKNIYRKKNRKSKFSKLDKKVDPNLLKKEDWMRLGLSEKQTDIVLKFSERGLRSNDDLKKIFVFPGELLKLIEDSLVYPEIIENKWNDFNSFNKEDADKEAEVFISVDINLADSVILKTIPGIGPFYAGKIVEHRNKLGGYLSLSQLTEIWNFDDEKLESIREYTILSKVETAKLNINQASVKELAHHPYITYKVANSIVQMRKVNGDYHNKEEILRSKLIDRKLYEKLQSYITTL